MRKSFSQLAIVLALLTGCTNNEDIQEGMFSEKEVLTDEQLMSTVPMKFAPVTMSATIEEVEPTRGSSDLRNGLLSNIGMYCLVKRAISDDAPIPSWKDASKDEYFKKMCIWKKNVPVSLKATGPDKGDIVWDNTMTHDYFPCYPDNEWFAYGFVAYYPRTDNIVYAYSSIKAYIKLDGSKPVFYGMAKEPQIRVDAATNSLGFSKKYYETLKTLGLESEDGLERYIYPYFEFEYLTSALNFVFASKTTPRTNLHVDKVEFDNFPCIMRLGLADARRYSDKKMFDMKSKIDAKPFVINNDKYNEFELSQFPELTSWLGHFELYEENGESISGQKNADGSYKYNLTTKQQKVGGGIYIPPVYSGHSKEVISVYITLADDYGNKYKCKNPVLVSTKSGWKKGASYNIPIYLNNPAEAARDATLAEWVAADPIEIDATHTTWVTP